MKLNLNVWNMDVLLSRNSWETLKIHHLDFLAFVFLIYMMLGLEP